MSVRCRPQSFNSRSSNYEPGLSTFGDETVKHKHGTVTARFVQYSCLIYDVAVSFVSFPNVTVTGLSNLTTSASTATPLAIRQCVSDSSAIFHLQPLSHRYPVLQNGGITFFILIGIFKYSRALIRTSRRDWHSSLVVP